MAEHSAILSNFIKLPFVIKIFVLSIFEWLLKTDFNVYFTKIGFQDHLLLNEVKNIAECSKRAFCNTFDLH